MSSWGEIVSSLPPGRTIIWKPWQKVEYIVDTATEIPYTAPVLSSPTGTQTGATTADGTVTSNEAQGTVCAGVWPTASTPSVADIIAGTGATYHTTDATPTAGVNSFAATGLTASTAYKWFFAQVDEFGNQSTAATSAEFTTAAGASGW